MILFVDFGGTGFKPEKFATKTYMQTLVKLLVNKAFIRTRKLQQIQALLNPTGCLPEVYLEHVRIQHLTQSLANISDQASHRASHATSR